MSKFKIPLSTLILIVCSAHLSSLHPQPSIPPLTELIHQKFDSILLHGESDLSTPTLHQLCNTLFINHPNRSMNGARLDKEQYKEYKNQTRAELQEVIEKNLWDAGYYHNLLAQEHAHPIQPEHAPQIISNACSYLTNPLPNNLWLFISNEQGLWLEQWMFEPSSNSCQPIADYHMCSCASNWHQTIAGIQQNMRYIHHFNGDNRPHVQFNPQQNTLCIAHLIEDDVTGETSLLLTQKKLRDATRNLNDFALQVSYKYPDITKIIDFVLHGNMLVGLAQKADGSIEYIWKCLASSQEISEILIHDERKNFTDQHCSLTVGRATDPYLFFVNHRTGLILKVNNPLAYNIANRHLGAYNLPSDHLITPCEQLRQLIQRPEGERQKMKYDEQTNCFFIGSHAFRFNEETSTFTPAPDVIVPNIMHRHSPFLIANTPHSVKMITNRRFIIDGLSTAQLGLLATIQKQSHQNPSAPLLLHPIYAHDYRAIEGYLFPQEQALCVFARPEPLTSSLTKRSRTEDDSTQNTVIKKPRN